MTCDVSRAESPFRLTGRRSAKTGRDCHRHELADRLPLGSLGRDIAVVEQALPDRQVCLPPVVLTELLSDPELPTDVGSVLRQLPLLPLLEGYWERAGALRAQVIAKGRKAPLADVLIAQSCLDNDVGLVTRDADFRQLRTIAELKLIP